MKSTPYQVHGFIYENKIINKYQLQPTKPCTHKFDAYYRSRIPVQIKCIKYGSEICLGSLLNNQSITSDFILHIGFWQTDKSNIIQEHTLYINQKFWFDITKFTHTQQMIREFRTAKNPHEIRTKYVALWKNKKTLSPIRPRFKVSKTKNTRRIQCSIRFKDFLNNILKCSQKFSFRIFRKRLTN